MTHAMASNFNGLKREEASTVYVPMRVAGLTENVVLNGDKTEVRLIGAHDEVLYSGFPDDFRIREESFQEPIHFTIGARRTGFVREVGSGDMPSPKTSVGEGEALVYQGLPLPRNLYARIKDQPLRLEFQFSFTLLGGTAYTVPAVGGDVRVSDVGRCKTQMDDDGDEIVMRCMQAGFAQTCASAVLENSSSQRRNPLKFSCWPNYSPYFGEYLPDDMRRFGIALPFHDLSGLTQYPVNASQIPESQVLVRVYRPQDHFTRRLVIPEIRLSDWESVERSN
jgi:hypothetical protein